jgi:hypothetical protein
VVCPPSDHSVLEGRCRPQTLETQGFRAVPRGRWSVRVPSKLYRRVARRSSVVLGRTSWGQSGGIAPFEGDRFPDATARVRRGDDELLVSRDCAWDPSVLPVVSGAEWQKVCLTNRVGRAVASRLRLQSDWCRPLVLALLRCETGGGVQYSCDQEAPRPGEPAGPTCCV